MDKLIPFKYDSKDVRVIKDDKGEPWWVAKDVCDVLELTNPTEAVRNLDDDERGTLRISEGTSSEGGNPNVNIISESGLYTLIIRSNKPEARKFRKWVTSEVLPSIRQTGSYSLPGCLKPDTSRKSLDAAREVERATRVFRASLSIAKTAGMKGRTAVFKANDATVRSVGFDCLEYIDADFNDLDVIDRYIEKRCMADEMATVAPPEIYRDYQEWCCDNNISIVLGKAAFYEKITQRMGINRRRPTGSTVEVFEGVGLKGGDA